MEILKFPHPALLKPCKLVKVFDEEFKKTLDEMYETMVNATGRGLASNQVGLNLRAFVMVTELGSRLNIVNPVVKLQSKMISKFKEGCLSFPGEYIVTNDRAEWIQIKYKDENGLNYSNVFTGSDAIVVQHEMQHLDGKVFIESEKLPTKERKKLAKKWGLR